MENTKDMIIKTLSELHQEIDNWEEIPKLVGGGTLDSLDIVTLIAELSDMFTIDIPPNEVIFENFDTVKGLTEMVERLRG